MNVNLEKTLVSCDLARRVITLRRNVLVLAVPRGGGDNDIIAWLVGWLSLRGGIWVDVSTSEVCVGLAFALSGLPGILGRI